MPANAPLEEATGRNDPARLEADRPVLLYNCNLIDGTGAPAQPGSAILIEGERIRAVWPGGVPEGLEDTWLAGEGGPPARLDLAGQTVIPGLIDMHVHLRGDEWALPLYLAHGVTTVRECGNMLRVLRYLDDLVATGQQSGPRLFWSGPLFDGANPGWPPFMCNAVGSTEQADRYLTGWQDHPVDFIKLYSNIEPREVRYMIERTQDWGYYLTMHPGQSDLPALLDAGLNGFEHIFSLSRYLAPQFFSGVGRRDNNGFYFRQVGALWAELGQGKLPAARAELLRLFDLMLKRQTILTPTLALNWSCGYQEAPEVKHNPLLGLISPSLRRIWAAGRLTAGWQEADYELSRRSTAVMAEYVAYYRQQGGPVLVGSDTPNAYLIPGLSLHQELEILAEAGLAPLELIRMASWEAAQVLERSERPDRARRFGKLAEGYLADLVVLTADPSHDIRRCRSIRWVVKGGQFHDPGRLAPLPVTTDDLLARTN